MLHRDAPDCLTWPRIGTYGERVIASPFGPGPIRGSSPAGTPAAPAGGQPITNRKVFDNKHDAAAVCRELHNLCPRNAEVINVEVAQDEPSSEVIPLTFSPLVEC